MKNKPTKYYVTTDLHFSHHRIVTDFGFRPSNFHDLIIRNWRDTVKKNDIVFDLGDVTWGSQGQLLQIMNGLPGTKILIRGNHDRDHSNNWFIKAGYSVVLEKAQACGVVLSHFPAILNEEELKRDLINVHGHFHNVDPKEWEKKLVERITCNHYLLSLENTNYTPISLELIKKRKFIKNSKKLLENKS